MSTNTTEGDPMSSTETQPSETSDLNPGEVDWVAVFDDHGFDPEGPVASNKFTTMLEIGDRVTGVDYHALLDAAVEEGYLARDKGGYSLPGASHQTAETDSETEEEAESDADEADEVDSEDEADIKTASETATEAPQKSRDDELAQEVEELREMVETQQETIEMLQANLNAFRSVAERQNQLLVGEEGITDYDTESATDHHTRLEQYAERLDDVEDKVSALGTGADGGSTPDKRAQAVRKALYNRAESAQNGKASLTRDEVDAVLNGGQTRDALLDAMRRAADGREADISGSSDLPPMDCIRVEIGGHGKQSRVVVDLDDATGDEERRISTTRSTGEGGR